MRESEVENTIFTRQEIEEIKSICAIEDKPERPKRIKIKVKTKLQKFNKSFWIAFSHWAIGILPFVITLWIVIDASVSGRFSSPGTFIALLPLAIGISILYAWNLRELKACRVFLLIFHIMLVIPAIVFTMFLTFGSMWWRGSFLSPCWVIFGLAITMELGLLFLSWMSMKYLRNYS